jgi:hypothetical protein
VKAFQPVERRTGDAAYAIMLDEAKPLGRAPASERRAVSAAGRLLRSDYRMPVQFIVFATQVQFVVVIRG